jgi:hypothetical protein
VDSDCQSFFNGCFQSGETLTTRGVKLNGIEALKFISFGTIKQRVQIGLVAGGGVGTLSGTIERRQFSVEQIPLFNTQAGRQVQTITTEDGKELFPLSYVPIGKVEIAVGAIVAPGLKIRAAGGLDFPGYNKFNLSAVYLFGSR